MFIINHKSLRNNFPEHSIKSDLDTEIILNAYEKWGINCLKHFNGIWSFVIYDK